jgi:XTP/dITP diphosphohydrolase
MLTAPNKILIASGNKGKIVEISQLLHDLGIEVVSAAEFNLPEPEENGLTFEENSQIKARYYGK